MAKRQIKRKSIFRLTAAANKTLNRHFSEIRKGIENISALHKYENNTSMTQSQFEREYIEKLLSTPITEISATLRGIMSALAKQKEAEIENLARQNTTPEKDTEE